MGEFADILPALADKRERARYKARRLAELSERTWTQTVGLYTVAVSGLSFDGEALCFDLTVTRGKRTVFTEDFRIINPPVMVSTGTETYVENGRTRKRPIFEERPLPALRQTVTDAVREYIARNRLS